MLNPVPKSLDRYVSPKFIVVNIDPRIDVEALLEPSSKPRSPHAPALAALAGHPETKSRGSTTRLRTSIVGPPRNPRRRPTRRIRRDHQAVTCRFSDLRDAAKSALIVALALAAGKAGQDGPRFGGRSPRRSTSPNAACRPPASSFPTTHRTSPTSPSVLRRGPPERLYDVLIVDEATTMLVEDADRARDHGRQLIVVGDDKQIIPDGDDERISTPVPRPRPRAVSVDPSLQVPRADPHPLLEFHLLRLAAEDRADTGDRGRAQAPVDDVHPGRGADAGPHRPLQSRGSRAHRRARRRPRQQRLAAQTLGVVTISLAQAEAIKARLRTLKVRGVFSLCRPAAESARAVLLRNGREIPRAGTRRNSRLDDGGAPITARLPRAWRNLKPGGPSTRSMWLSAGRATLATSFSATRPARSSPMARSPPGRLALIHAYQQYAMLTRAHDLLPVNKNLDELFPAESRPASSIWASSTAGRRPARCLQIWRHPAIQTSQPRPMGRGDRPARGARLEHLPFHRRGLRAPAQ